MLEGNTAPNTRRPIALPPSAFNATGENGENAGDRGPALDDIAREAYAIYEANGWQHGHDVEHWLEAERRLIARAIQDPKQDASVGAARKRSTRGPATTGALASATRRK